jgi:hypothetical protein
MKKLIAIAVVFALVSGVAFAVDVTGTVFGVVNVREGDTGKDEAGDANPLKAGGEMGRIRLDGAGEAGEGAFGGYVRFDFGHKDYLKATDYDGYKYDGVNKGYMDKDGADFLLVDSAYAWWKPIDQFKLTIGGFSDAFWGKEGNTGWMFNQMPNDSGIAINPGIWCGDYWGSTVYGSAGDPWSAYMHNRYVFLEGFQYYGASLEIKPLDMLGINIGIPFISAPRGGEFGDIFQASLFQIDLNFDFGNIALTYDGANRAGMKAGVNADDADGGALYVYYGGSFGDLSLDVGFALHFAGAADEKKAKWGTSDKALPIGVGLGLKYATDAFGVKLRATAALGGELEGSDGTYINASLLPYFTINDSMSAFVNVGLGMVSPKEGDASTGWYFNPYLRVGADWGPTFYFGIKVWSEFNDGSTDAIINFAVPISLMVSF